MVPHPMRFPLCNRNRPIAFAEGHFAKLPSSRAAYRAPETLECVPVQADQTVFVIVVHQWIAHAGRTRRKAVERGVWSDEE